jgi:SAM-dependent methyltransferase
MQELPTRPISNQTSFPHSHDSYDPKYFRKLFKVEDEHFWFSTRNKIIGRLVTQLQTGFAPGYRVLEVGCGTGNVLRVLERTCKNGSVVGMDLFSEGLQFARQRTKCSLVQGDVQTPPFNVQFDLIGVFDVLEHLPNDIEILSNILALLAPGGRLILTVPAHMSLWSYFDVASHHCRRYELRELRQKLAQSGYSIDYMTQYMAAIFPLVWLGRRVAAIMARGKNGGEIDADSTASNELKIVPVVNSLLKWVLGAEASLLGGRRHLPIGTSILAVVHKKQ